MYDLTRFEGAQDRPDMGYAAALAEMRAGQKRSHWIWYIFPQLRELGRSSVAIRFGIEDVDEAAAYLRHDKLRGRLLEISAVVAAQLTSHPPVPPTTLMGSRTDTLKLVSSMTLFGEVALRLKARDGHPDHAAQAELSEQILEATAVAGFRACGRTLAELGM